MLEQISTSRDQYTLAEQSYTPTNSQLKHAICFLCTIQVPNGAFHTLKMYKFDMI